MRVYRINGRAASEDDSFELRSLFRREGATVTLEIDRSGRRETVDFKLRRLI
jgi:hypothetical protein